MFNGIKLKKLCGQNHTMNILFYKKILFCVALRYPPQNEVTGICSEKSQMKFKELILCGQNTRIEGVVRLINIIQPPQKDSTTIKVISFPSVGGIAACITLSSGSRHAKYQFVYRISTHQVEKIILNRNSLSPQYH